MRRVLAVTLAALVLFGASAAHAATATTRRPVWAFCGVEPTDPHAATKVAVMAAAGVTATLGPCRRSPADYSPVHPGSRYASRGTYLALVLVNARAGLQTVVFDPAMFSERAVERYFAKAFWQPYMPWIAAFDIGDEYAIAKGQFDTMIARYDAVRMVGAQPYANQLPFTAEMDAFVAREPGQMLSFDDYDGHTPAIAGHYAATTPVMCAVQAVTFPGHTATAAKVVNQFHTYTQAGCSAFLLFGGERPQADGFPSPSLVTRNGAPTPIALALETQTP